MSCRDELSTGLRRYREGRRQRHGPFDASPGQDPASAAAAIAVVSSAEPRRHAQVQEERRVAVVLHEGAEALPPQPPEAVRFVAISDTHCQHEVLAGMLPAGDVLLHCGDCTNAGTMEEFDDFCRFVKPLPFRHKLLVPGNHDFLCDADWYDTAWQEWHEAYQSPAEAAALLQDAGLRVLHGDLVQVCGLSLYGSAAQPRLPKMRKPMAFGRTRGAALKAEWEQIPAGVDVLVTHTPPAGILDASPYAGKSIGCEELKKALPRVKPAVHVFGHVHAGHGSLATKHTLFLNAASAKERQGEGGTMHMPIVFDVLRRA